MNAFSWHVTNLSIVLGVLITWPSATQAVFVDALQVRGDVLAENHIFFTGSQSVSHEVLQQAFLDQPAEAPGGLCPLKNMGDRNCDGQIRNDDLAFFAGQVGPLVQHGEAATGFATGSYDVTTNESFFFVAAWASEGNEGIAADLEFRQPTPNGMGLDGPQVVTDKDDAIRFANWQACATGFDVDQPPTRLEVLEAIEKCDSPGEPNWVAPVVETGPVNLPDGFNGNAEWFWPDSAGVNELVLLRHALQGSKTPLSIRDLDLGDTVSVTVDPFRIVEYQLDLEFDPGRFTFLRVEPITPYSADTVDQVLADGVVDNILGTAPVDEVPAIEVDVFRVVFQKRDPGDAGPFDFRVFAGPEDFVTAFDTETGEQLRVDSSRIEQAALGTFALDLNPDRTPDGVVRDGVNGADINIACSGGEVLTPWLEETGFVLGDIDFDGAIQFGDFLTASNNVGQLGAYSDGDVDCNGHVEVSDAQFILANLGRGAAPAVPEPSSLALLSLGALMAGLVRRHR